MSEFRKAREEELAPYKVYKVSVSHIGRGGYEVVDAAGNRAGGPYPSRYKANLKARKLNGEDYCPTCGTLLHDS